MDLSGSRGRKILQLVMQSKANNKNLPEETTHDINNLQKSNDCVNSLKPIEKKESSQNSAPEETSYKAKDLQTSNNCSNSYNKENSFSDNDDGDFSPASDDDKTYMPPETKRRRPRSASSSSSSFSSSSTSSSSSSSLSSKSSSSSSSDINTNTHSTNINTSETNLELHSDNIDGITTGENEQIASGIIDDITESNINNAQFQVNNIAEDIPSNIDSSTKKSKKKNTAAKIAKNLKDSGKSYVSASKTRKVFPAKALKNPCGPSCRLKCTEKISEEMRKQLFKDYWGMASLIRQREYIAGNIEEIRPKYQYKKVDSTRKLKNYFYFNVNGSRTKICKTFFKNTLNITDRCIRTVVEKRNESGVLDGEMRGKHGKHTKVPNDLIEGVKNHINSIPRIESHYLRKQTTKEYIDGGKTLTDIYFDYKTECIRQGLSYVMIHTYRNIFNTDFNIGFFVPKKDQCEQCTIYKLAVGPKKIELQENYERHLAEKEKSREEKASDKEKISHNFIVACYDLQAVMTVPNGEVSTFYYKSKINCLNFTISELKHDVTECYFWDESQGNRGANEIGSCILKYLQKKSCAGEELDVVFFSDNCCGQQKNQFIIGMYIYAVLNLNIKSITHKFLIRGHTQNEGDAVHSVIEKQVKKCLKSGPIYVPSQYVSAIRNAKKRGIPFTINEMGYGDFIDIKQLPVPRLNKSIDGQVVKLSDIKVIKVEKSDQNEIKILYKISYFDDFKELDISKRNRNNRPSVLKPLYQRKLDVSERKRSDIKSLFDAGLIPSYYRSFYENI